jgi:nitrilase
MRATVIQFEPGSQRAPNIDTAARLIAEAIAADRPALISLPEMWSCLGGSRDEKLAEAEALPANGTTPGPAYAFLQETARRHGITVHGGSIGERDGPDRLYNTTLVFGPDGAELARYRKIHLFDITTPSGTGYRESALFSAGETVVTAPLGAVTLGLTICYDLRFPELFVALRRAGAEAIAVPSAFTVETGRDHWEILLRARAIETQAWVLAAATTGRHFDAQGAPRYTWGHSMIVDPWGHIAASLEAAPGFATAELDLAQVTRVRTAMPVHHHRRLP